MNRSAQERQRRWRLILGPLVSSNPSTEKGEVWDQDGLGSEEDRRMDRILDLLDRGDRAGGFAESSPAIIEWFEDVRRTFPEGVSRLIQREAIDRIGLQRLLDEPPLVEHLFADGHLLPELLRLSSSLPSTSRLAARTAVRRFVDQAVEQLRLPVEQAVYRHLARIRPHSPLHHSEIDWPRTIRANLRHYQPEYQTVIPVKRIARPAGQLQRALRSITICVDLSRSMAGSTIHSTIVASILARIPNLRTRLVAFDTSVVDLTSQLADPVDLLLGLNLGGGTDIRRALEYCRQLHEQDSRGIIFLISDLRDGSSDDELIRSFQLLISAGQRVVPLLSLNDDGRQIDQPALTRRLASIGISTIVASPDKFPELLATTLDQL